MRALAALLALAVLAGCAQPAPEAPTTTSSDVPPCADCLDLPAGCTACDGEVRPGDVEALSFSQCTGAWLTYFTRQDAMQAQLAGPFQNAGITPLAAAGADMWSCGQAYADNVTIATEVAFARVLIPVNEPSPGLPHGEYMPEWIVTDANVAAVLAAHGFAPVLGNVTVEGDEATTTAHVYADGIHYVLSAAGDGNKIGIGDGESTAYRFDGAIHMANETHDGLGPVTTQAGALQAEGGVLATLAANGVLQVEVIPETMEITLEFARLG